MVLNRSSLVKRIENMEKEGVDLTVEKHALDLLNKQPPTTT